MSKNKTPCCWLVCWSENSVQSLRLQCLSFLVFIHQRLTFSTTAAFFLFQAWRKRLFNPQTYLGNTYVSETAVRASVLKNDRFWISCCWNCWDFLAKATVDKCGWCSFQLGRTESPSDRQCSAAERQCPIWCITIWQRQGRSVHALYQLFFVQRSFLNARSPWRPSALCADRSQNFRTSQELFLIIFNVLGPAPPPLLSSSKMFGQANPSWNFGTCVTKSQLHLRLLCHDQQRRLCSYLWSLVCFRIWRVRFS